MSFASLLQKTFYFLVASKSIQSLIDFKASSQQRISWPLFCRGWINWTPKIAGSMWHVDGSMQRIPLGADGFLVLFRIAIFALRFKAF